MSKQQVSAKTKYMVTMAMLSAVIVLMAYTPLGYLKIGIVEISFLSLPVAVGGVLLGTKAAIILGGIFGLTSFFQCFGMSAFGVTLLSINPVFMFFTCLVPRMMIGFFSGSVYSALEKHKGAPFFAAFTASLTNTVFFLGSVMLFFGSSAYIQSFGDSFVSILFALGLLNAIIELPCCTLAGGMLCKILKKALNY